MGHPARKEVTEIDPESDTGRRVLRLMRIENDHPLWPADEATAKACSVPFVATTFSDGEHRKARGKKSPSGKGGSSNSNNEGDQ